jgi:outer membrane protein assembly factor BamA
VEISGNQAVDTGTLLRAANEVAIGVPLTDARLKQILDGSLKLVYASKGFVGVTFPKVEAVPAKTNDGVTLKIQVLEGPVYNVGSIRFRGTGMDPEQVKSNIPFHPGQVFDAKKVDDFRIWLAHNLRQAGHLDASVTFDSDTDNSKRVVNLLYSVAPGPIYTFASLDVQGLDVASSPAVEQLWGEKQGKPFNPDYPDFFLKRVEERNMFEHLADTHSDYTADPASHTVIVHLYFKGGKTKQERAKEEEDKRENRKTDGTWSPYFLPAN